MKRFFFILASCFLLSTHMTAQTIIPFSTQIIDPEPIGHPMPRNPILSPTVYIEDYTLTFLVGHPEYVLYIKDENDAVVYTTVVTSTETLVTLPSTLSGEYKIELVMDNWLFTGWIDI